MSNMRAIVLLAIIAVAAAARDSILAKPQDLVLNKQRIAAINADPRSSWKAGENDFFKGMTHQEARKYLGTILDVPEEISSLTAVRTFDEIPDSDIPDSFDAREQWPNYIHPIRNQQRCGSCWAFGASEVLSDRFAIATNGTVNLVLSPEDLVSCDSHDMGCQGGMLNMAWKYLQEEGIVTDSCFPYTAGNGSPAKCATKCVDGTPFKKYKAADHYNIKAVADIQKAIMTNGPVEAGFSVYSSFMTYKSGVYERHWWQFWDTLEGGHAIKIIGWGSEDGKDYWLIANSWGTSWGIDGTFKILRGKNECGIEDQVFAGHAAV